MSVFAAIAGAACFAAGVACSALAFGHDVRRIRIARDVPQAAPKRIAPEIHALAAGVAATGAGVPLGMWFGVAWFAAHLLLSYAVVRPLIERR